ncbi:hypothetical protein E4U21_006431 [Claviceps maximensis]|nr:hypothetical protein E4U21_006431 [Claviceps maximensis]
MPPPAATAGESRPWPNAAPSSCGAEPEAAGAAEHDSDAPGELCLLGSKHAMQWQQQHGEAGDNSEHCLAFVVFPNNIECSVARPIARPIARPVMSRLVELLLWAIFPGKPQGVWSARQLPASCPPTARQLLASRLPTND